jgi:hypothetical protein
LSDYLIFETKEFRKKLSKLPAGDAKFIRTKLLLFSFYQLMSGKTLTNKDCNHMHGTYGNWVSELKTFCSAAEIECVVVE